MKTRMPLRLVSALGFMSVTLAAGSIGSAPPAASSAAASAPVVREPPPEPLEAQSIPAAPSKPPTLEEWKTATPIEPTRRSRDAWPCRAYRVREWLKVKCQLMVAEIRQFGGSPEGVFLWIGPKADFVWEPKNGGEVILPMRPGDRRIVQFFELVPNMCVGMVSDSSVIVDEAWIEGEKGPTVVLR
jgi:hypothetical protein